MDREAITTADFEAAIDRIIAGLEKKMKRLAKKESTENKGSMSE